jgi:predicted LPLAT superfamily acyltransferase
MERTDERQWQGKTDGTPWMHRTLISMFKFIPLPVMYFFMSFTIPYYLIAHRKERRAIYHYFRRRQGYSRLKASWHTIANHYVFGAVVMDKFASYAGRKFKITVENMDIFRKYAFSDKGFVMLTAHVGNGEICGYSLKAPKRMNVLAYGGEAETISQSRSRILTSNNIRLIPTDDDMEYLFVIRNALDDGEILSLHADRVYGSSKTVSARLLGSSADLPVGPFAVSLMGEVPALTVFAVKKSLNSYKIFIENVDGGAADAPMNERAAAMAQSYCNNLGKVLRQHPNQWFNYYEFWND